MMDSRFLIGNNITDSLNSKILVFESIDSLYFDIKRIYIVHQTQKDKIRGHHAHRNLMQILSCPKGSIKVNVFDGISSSEFILNDSSNYLYIGPMIWRTMEWLVDDSVLVVLASENYDESDYIRDYNVFLGILANKKSHL